MKKFRGLSEMALESQLWQRCKLGLKTLRLTRHKVDVQRVENAAVSGHPDVEGCIDGRQLWVELKSCARPVRPDTPIRPKKRLSQEIWHRQRTDAGCRFHWILIQVGEDRDGVLYLIPGKHYAAITVPEVQLAALSVIPNSATAADAMLRASQEW